MNTPTDRLAPANYPDTMMAIVTTGNGGYDKLVFSEVAVPKLGIGEVLLQVLAAGMNNTEINARLGWYSSSVTTATDETDVAADAASDGGWNEATPFPIIQGADCCGRIIAVGPGGDDSRMGERVLVRACRRPSGYATMENVWMGSDFDGAFAQFVKVPASEAFAVDCDWSDAELATIPCAYGTAENMIHRAGVVKGARVLVTGASGGVGSAAVQLAKRRGAEVIAVAGRAKMERVRSAGADHVVERNADLGSAIGNDSVDVAVDIVGGPGFGSVLSTVKRGGTYVTAGAIGGPIVQLDMRTFYLRDIKLVGCTAWDEPVFPNLVSCIERGEIRPLLAKTFPLEQIAAAQREFLEKRHVGNFALIPPTLEA